MKYSTACTLLAEANFYSAKNRKAFDFFDL